MLQVVPTKPGLQLQPPLRIPPLLEQAADGAAVGVVGAVRKNQNEMK